MRSVLTLALLAMLPSCAAHAPPVNGVMYGVRVAYLTDVKVAPYESRKRCEVTRRFIENELPELPGYAKVVVCTPVGNF